MEITISPEQEDWLRSRVVAGAFASIGEAARQVIDDRLAEERRLTAERQWEALFVGELSDADLDAIARTEMAARHQHLDVEFE
jgi:antitoxin ParD1/3/4